MRVKPKVVVEVSFVEWPRNGLLLHSEFVALREDKIAEEVHRDIQGTCPQKSEDGRMQSD